MGANVSESTKYTMRPGVSPIALVYYRKKLLSGDDDEEGDANDGPAGVRVRVLAKPIGSSSFSFLL